MADSEVLTNLPIRKIAIFRALKLGDFLVATPALRAIRAAFPDAHVDYVGLPATRELVMRYTHYIDGFVEFSGLPGLPEQVYTPQSVLAFIGDMQNARYDLVLQIHGDGSVINPFIELFGATYSAGFASKNSYWPDRQRYMHYPTDRSELNRMLGLVGHLGIPLQGNEPDFPVTEDDEAGLAQLPETETLGQDFVCIHAGAASSVPWKAENFAIVADVLVGHGYKVAFDRYQQRV